MKSKSSTLLVLVLLLASSASGASLRFHNFYTNNMVLQRDKPVLIKGWADPGAAVAVTFAGQEKKARADKKGAWSVVLDAINATAKPQTLTVQSSAGKQKASIKNLLVGDVVIFARQTTIDVSLGRSDKGKQAAAAQNPTPLLRVMRISTIPAKDPQDGLAKESVSGWARVDKQTALSMSASAFYLARDLARKVDVPLGMVDINMGHHFAAAWLSPEALDESEELYPSEDTADLRHFRKHLPAEADAWASGETEKQREEYYKTRMKGQGQKPSLGLAPLQYPYYPSAAYNAVIHPLRGIAAKAIVLQLGNDYPMVAYSILKAAGKVTDLAELDRAWPQTYGIFKYGNRMTPTTLPLIPRDLRRALGDETLPIGMILPPGSDFFDHAVHNREVRELLRRTQKETKGLGLIVPGARHIPLSGQPADDGLLAKRCRQWIMGAVYKSENVVPAGPLFLRMEKEGLRSATIFFKQGSADGLRGNGDALKQFEAAGSDKEFFPCEARVDGDTIRVTSDKVNAIVSVRYNWKQKPDEGLVNSAGLPAIPFTTLEDWQYLWWAPNPPVELPVEYATTANRWPERDVAIINGANKLAEGDSQPNPNHLGPTGIISAPFGPNLYVHGTEVGSPADGKLFVGDLIYGVNGTEFGEDKYRQFANAITHSESEAGKGKLTLGVRRKGKNITVELQLEVLGSYSSTTPYYCPKSEEIVSRAEAWIAKRYRPESGPIGNPTGMLDTDLYFLMASGKPQYQGLVRRAIYAKMASMTPLSRPNPKVAANSWHLGYTATLFGEYYHLTGDKNVLPYLKNQVDWAAITQIKPPGPEAVSWEVAQMEESVGAWRTKYNPDGADRWRSGYGLMAAAGIPCTMGLQLAKEAGVNIDEVALQRGITHFNKGRAEYGYVLYGYGPQLRKDGPDPINPDVEAAGLVNSMNGKLGTAAALFRLLGNKGTTAICARACVYAFNKTRTGHGGMFFNNFWTPIGAHAAGERGFKHFMKHQTWWRELFRRQDGSFDQAGRGKIGVAYALPLVAPHKRLRMLGAPHSAFGVHPPAYLRMALAAHRKRDYARAERLIKKELKERIIPAEDQPIVEHMLTAVQRVRKSIEHDLAYTEKLIADGKHYYATFELAQLKGVVAPDNPRLAAIEKALGSPEGKEKIRESSGQVSRQQSELRANLHKQQAAKAQDKRVWAPLTTNRVDSPKHEMTTWRMKVLESRKSAPEGWVAPGFDDSGWEETSLPISWRVSHDALLRGTFTVKDKKAFDALRIHGRYMRQDNIEVYINGQLVAKLNNIGRGTTPLSNELTGYALEVLRNGRNTIAVVTTHLKRWGKVKGQFNKVDGEGFRIQLEASKANEKE